MCCVQNKTTNFFYMAILSILAISFVSVSTTFAQSKTFGIDSNGRGNPGLLKAQLQAESNKRNFGYNLSSGRSNLMRAFTPNEKRPRRNDGGNLNLPHLKKVCEGFGYQTYVSSTARDQERSSRYPNGKTNWHSAGDNGHYIYEGNTFVSKRPGYYRTHLATITCKDPFPQCSDRIDNDGDGKIDLNDPECSNADDDDESAPAAQCNDGKDNDGDGKIDALVERQREGNPGRWVATWAKSCNTTCSAVGLTAGVNQFGDACVSGEVLTYEATDPLGLGIFRAGCWSSSCATKAAQSRNGGPHTGRKMFSHGIYCYTPGQKRDNDATDITAACFCKGSGNVFVPACDNGKDDDGDGKIDLADDGCASKNDISEIPHDPDCDSPTDNDESPDIARVVTISPQGNITDTTPTFKWRAASGAASYELYVSRKATPNTPLRRKVTPNLEFTFTNPFAPGEYSFWVRGLKDNKKGPWSAVKHFTISTQCSDGINNDPAQDNDIDEADAGCWTDPNDPNTYDPNRNRENEAGRVGKVVLIDPANGSTLYNRKPTFKWRAVKGAVKYRFYLRHLEGNNPHVDFTPTSNTFTPTNNLPFGNYRWRVRAFGAGGFIGEWSETFSFSVTAQCSDGVDNDNDGATDLDDFSCGGNPNRNNESTPLAQCQDGQDNDNDGRTDLRDPGCNDKQDNSEDSEAECSDNIDNDNDGAIDMQDFSCSGPNDDDETNPKPQCNDGVDNDGDRRIDLMDPGCTDKQDNSEDSEPECSDGIDNDNDGAVDTQDFSCSGPNDDDETNPKPQCNDGIDNDGDNLVDLNDPGCTSRQDNDETHKTECNDGIDNDNDGAVDLADFSCSSSNDTDEEFPKSQCQDGIDNDNDQVIDTRDPGCDNNQDNDESNGTTVCQDGLDNDSDNLVDMADPGCDAPTDNSEEDAYSCQTPNPYAKAIVTSTTPVGGTTAGFDILGAPDGLTENFDNDGTTPGFVIGAFDMNTKVVDGPGYDIAVHLMDFFSGQTIEAFEFAVSHDGVNFVSLGVRTPNITTPNIASVEYFDLAGCGVGEVKFFRITNANISNNISTEGPDIDAIEALNPMGTCECNDGLDNDSDGASDMNDFSCSSPTDDDETNPKAQCQDGIDNDNDTLVDMADPGCDSNQDNDETHSTECSDGIDNDNDGAMDLNDFSCSDMNDDDETNPKAQCQDGTDNDGDTLVDLLDPGCTSSQDNDESHVTECSDNIDNDNDGHIDRSDFSCTGPNDDDETNPKAQCQDEIDNDGDTLIDLADPGCTNNQDNDEFNTTECSDNIDNDNDGYIDRSDFSCTGPEDDDETNPKAQCQDEIDNDGDTLIDLADPGCTNNQDNDETHTTQCNDGVDNDNDGATDLDDFSCEDVNDDDESDPKAQCQDEQDNDGDTLVDLLDPGCDSAQDNDESNTTQCTDGIDNDNDGAIDGDDFSCEDDNDDDESSPKAQCQDEQDNDGDTLIDLADPGCESAQDNDEDNATQCNDGIDNDGDNAIDLADFSCGNDSNNDDESSPQAECQDGIDNDGDTLVDLADPGCDSDQDNDETHTTQCSDGIDNDQDGATDLDDFSCENDPNNDDETLPASQCQDGLDNDGDTYVDSDDVSCTSPQDNDESDNEPQCQDGDDNDGDGLIDAADPNCLDDNGNYDPNDPTEAQDACAATNFTAVASIVLGESQWQQAVELATRVRPVVKKVRNKARRSGNTSAFRKARREVYATNRRVRRITRRITEMRKNVLFNLPEGALLEDDCPNLACEDVNNVNTKAQINRLLERIQRFGQNLINLAERRKVASSEEATGLKADNNAFFNESTTQNNSTPDTFKLCNATDVAELIESGDLVVTNNN